MRTRIAYALALAATTIGAACGGHVVPRASGPTLIVSSASLVTRPELARYDERTLAEALRRTRPALLNARGGTLSVAIGGRIIGGAELLDQIAASDVELVERLAIDQAAVRYGPDVRGPVLVVTLRTR